MIIINVENIIYISLIYIYIFIFWGGSCDFFQDSLMNKS